MPSNQNILLILFIASVLSVITPCIISMLQLIWEVRKNFITDEYNGGLIRSWLLKNSNIMYLATLLCGSSFASVSILNVKMMYYNP